MQIDLSMAGGVLSLEISDNGRGLSQEDLAKARSFGIRGLHERANTVGGWIDLSSGPHGTTLILSVPLDVPDSATSRAPTSTTRAMGDVEPDRASLSRPPRRSRAGTARRPTLATS